MNNPDSNQTDNKTSGLSPIAIFTALIAAALGIWVSMQFFSDSPSGTNTARPISLDSGTYMAASRSLADFNLSNHAGKPFNRASLNGQWTFLFFGYTHCPDVCPNTMTTLKVLSSQLEKTAQAINSTTRYVFVSVDPKRDTPQHLSKFVQYFNKQFVGVTGPHPELKKLTGQLGILYAIDDKSKKENYHVDHSAHIILIDPNGHYKAVFSYPHNVRKLLDDYKKIRGINKG